MQSREIVKRCVHFQDPPRVPLIFSKFGVNDTLDLFDFFIKDAHGTDPWGITWQVHPDIPSIGIPKEHLVQSRDDLEKITVPDPVEFAARVKANIDALTPEQREKYRFIATSSGIWEVPQHYRGMEGIFDDLIFDPEMVHTLVNTCADFWVNFLEELGPMKDDVDALYMFDDWGTQQDAMISPAMWREFFAVPYRRITTAAHANGMDFWLHSCGRVTNLIEDFIGVGMDLINPYQSGTCGYEEVAQRFAGRVAFLTNVDTQTTLTHGSVEEVLADCLRLQQWMTPHGGLIVSAYGYDAPDVNEQTVFSYFHAMQLVDRVDRS